MDMGGWPCEKMANYNSTDMRKTSKTNHTRKVTNKPKNNSDLADHHSSNNQTARLKGQNNCKGSHVEEVSLNTRREISKSYNVHASSRHPSFSKKTSPHRTKSSKLRSRKSEKLQSFSITD